MPVYNTEPNILIGKMAEKADAKPPPSPPPGYRKVKREYWEGVDPHKKRPAINKHTGVYAYHADDCMCGMAGWPCVRNGAIWSCCGKTEKYCMCTGKKKK